MNRLRYLGGPGLQLMLIACGLGVPLAEGIKRGAEQALAVAEIEKLGGKWSRDETNPARPAVMVSFRGISARDADVAHLKWLSHLRFLSLSETEVSDAGVAHLKTLTNLEFLYLDKTRITDAGLDQLRGLPNLRSLSLVGTHVTESGVKRLQRQVPRLEVIRTR